MNFLQDFEQKYLPNIYNARMKGRMQRAVDIKEKALKQPEKLDWSQIRLILRLLKTQKKLPANNKSDQLQNKFLTVCTLGTVPALLIALSSNLLKQIYKMQKRKKLLIMAPIFGIVYFSIVYQPLKELNDHNRKLAHELAGQLKLNII